MLNPGRFALTEHHNQNWTVTVEEGTKLEDILNPSFFANVAINLRPYDKINVRIDTEEYYAELLVLQASKNMARVAVLQHVNFKELKGEQVSKEVNLEDAVQFKVQFCGPQLRFCVIRKADGARIKEKCQDKEEAESWLAGHLKAQLI